MRFQEKSAGGGREEEWFWEFFYVCKKDKNKKEFPWPFHSDLKADEMFGAMATMTQWEDKNEDKSQDAKNTDKKEPVSLVTF